VNVDSENPRKVQMGGRYPESVVDEAHEYARRHRLHLNVVLAAAVAEYLAKRRDRESDDPAPQLHYRRGHESAESMRLREQLMRVDPRGRKLQSRSCRATSVGDGKVGDSKAKRQLESRFADAAMAHDAADGPPARRASEDPAQVRQRRSRPHSVRHADGNSLALAR
jgi:hypothetical protein